MEGRWGVKCGHFLYRFAEEFCRSFAEEFLEGEKQTGAISSRNHSTLKRAYMCLTIASPNSEHFSSLAPSIRRSKS